MLKKLGNKNKNFRRSSTLKFVKSPPLARTPPPKGFTLIGAYDPPIYDIASGYRVCPEASRWTPDAIWFRRYFHPQANVIIYLECPEY